MHHSTFKIDSRVAVYGSGVNTNADLHNGCRGRIAGKSVCNDCFGNEITIYGVEFDNKSFDWFHVRQLRKLVRK